MKKDDIKTIVVVVVVCVICLTIGLILNHKSNFEKLSPVNEYGVFFSEVRYINNFINYVSNNDDIGVYNLLDEKYIEENNISYDNVLEYVDDYPRMSSFKANSIEYVKLGSNVTLYYVNGDVYQNDFESERLVDEDVSIVLINDFDNLSFSIYPVEDNYKSVINGLKRVNVEVNDYNKIVNTDLIDKEQVCVLYYSDFMNMLMNNIEKSYDYLSDDMKNRYTTTDSYIDFVNGNNDLFSTNADKCRVDEVDEKRVYSVIDENGNEYSFTEESVMNYKVSFYLK